MKTILVTGATGFIGNKVVEELLGKGYKVIATSLQKQKAMKKKWFDKVIYIPFDFSSFDEKINYFDFFQQPELLIHLAWKGLPNYKNQFHISENLASDIRFLKNILDHGLKDITVIGTCLEYGLKDGCLNEEMECNPENPYSIAKNELRKYLQIYTNEKEINFKWVRLFYIYGKGQNENSLFSQLQFAILKNEKVFNMSGGEQLRDYLPVKKVAEYIVEIAVQKKITGIINCCSGKPVRVLDLVENFIKEKGAKIQLNKGFYPYPDYEPMSFWGNNSKLKKIIKND